VSYTPDIWHRLPATIQRLCGTTHCSAIELRRHYKMVARAGLEPALRPL